MHHLIQEQGFEATLGALVDYAETQAHLHQSLGDRPQWEIWAKNWANLHEAADRISFQSVHGDWLEMWIQHMEDSRRASTDFNYRG